MASRRIEDLSSDMQSMAKDFLSRVEFDPWLTSNGISLLVTCTYRSNEEQAMLYAQGRTKPGAIVTRALPGQSKHNAMSNGRPAAEAIDVVPLRHGKAIWGTQGDGIDEDPSDDATDDLEAWQRVGEHGKAAGLIWYGDPGSPFREFPHFQNPKA